jgi:hypothetical protein
MVTRMMLSMLVLLWVLMAALLLSGYCSHLCCWIVHDSRQQRNPGRFYVAVLFTLAACAIF